MEKALEETRRLIDEGHAAILKASGKWKRILERSLLKSFSLR